MQFQFIFSGVSEKRRQITLAFVLNACISEQIFSGAFTNAAKFNTKLPTATLFWVRELSFSGVFVKRCKSEIPISLVRRRFTTRN